MSSTIEYRHVAVKVDLANGLEAMKRLDPGMNNDLLFAFSQFGYLMFVEEGCSNTFDHDGRKARNWDLRQIGSSVMEQVIQGSVYAEAGLTKLRGRDVQAEAYIKHYRKELKEAISSDDASPPFLTFRLAQKFLNPTEAQKHYPERIERHPFTAYLRARDLLRVMPESIEYGQTVPAYYALRVQQCQGRGGAAMDEWNAAMTWLMLLGQGGYYPSDLEYRFSRVESSNAFSGWLNDLVLRKQQAVAA